MRVKRRLLFARDRLHRPELFRCQRTEVALTEHVDQPDHGGERRTELVGDVADQVGLDLVELPELLHLAPEPVLERLPLRHVPHRHDDPVDRRIVEEVAAHGFDRQPRPVAPPDPELLLRPQRRIGEERGEEAVEVRQVLGVDEIVELRADQRTVGVARRKARRRGLVVNDELGVEDRDDVRRLLHEGRQALVAPPPEEIVGQRGPLQGHGHLGDQRLDGRQQARRDLPRAGDPHRPVGRRLGPDRQLDDRRAGDRSAPGRGTGRARSRNDSGAGRSELEPDFDGRHVGGQRPGCVAGDGLDRRPVRGATEGDRRPPEHALSEEGTVLVVDASPEHLDQADHPCQHQQEQQGRRRRRDRERRVRVAKGLDDADHGSDERRPRQRDEPPTGEGRLTLGNRLAQPPHAGVERCRPPEQVVDQPPGVEQAALAVPGVQLDEAVHRVGRQQAHDADPDEVEADRPVARADREPGGNGEEHHVHQWIGDRDDPVEERQPVGVGVGLDDKHPDQQPQPDGDDRGVEQAGPVPPRRAGAEQQEQADDQERVDRQVEEVTDRRKVEVEGVVEDVADHERDLGGDEEHPRQGLSRAVPDDADDDRGRRRKPDQAVHEPVAAHSGHHEVPGRRDRSRAQVQPADPASHTTPFRHQQAPP